MEEIKANLRTRLASPEDAEAVLALWTGSAKWLNNKGINQWRPEYFNLRQVLDFMNDRSDVYLAELFGETVGTYVLTWSDPVIWKELDNRDAGYIHRFAVDRKHQARGIGSCLLQTAETQIYQKGKRFARLDCMAEKASRNRSGRPVFHSPCFLLLPVSSHLLQIQQDGAVHLLYLLHLCFQRFEMALRSHGIMHPVTYERFFEIKKLV